MTEIEQLLTEYNIKPKNTALIDYYHQDNIWKTLRIERDENRHSAFLKWLLEKDHDDSNSPLMRFLNLLVRNAEKQFNVTGYIALKRAVLSKKLQIKGLEISLEKQICQLSKIRYTDRLDVYIDCKIEGVPPYEKLEFFVENKVDSVEGKNKLNDLRNPSNEENIYKDKWQTERYCYACSSKNNLRNDSFDASRTLQLFVFLTSKEQSPKEKEFITVSYQDLVDYVIQPYLVSNSIDERSKLMLTDYLRVLGNPYNEKLTTMAVTQEEKELLIDFYNDNVALFKKALEVMQLDAQTANDVEEQEDIKNIINAIERKRPKRQYTINGNNNPKTNRPYTMYEVIEAFVKFRLQGSCSVEDIDQEISGFVFKKGSKRINVSRKAENVFQANKGVTEANDGSGTPFFITHQWAGGDNGFFTRFYQGVNSKYDGFQIKEL